MEIEQDQNYLNSRWDGLRRFGALLGLRFVALAEVCLQKVLALKCSLAGLIGVK